MSRFVALLIALIPLILSKIFIASWVYKDAKSRGLDPPHLWVVLILFFSGSLAFLLYILVIRDEKKLLPVKIVILLSLLNCPTVEDVARKWR